ncbi:pyridoxal phosphate-dependent decarboxylase family protein [Aureivirga marina]|uniref:pyridoxal phosphate-dependent decarboxylase family protein n=1 Tax=Aureivirga marina TaxID=1182451 RepID=UPI001E3FA078|nr:aminotransferase class I/II-fold pyridoxal phosphate-dependent enzyme [Aureivirga marina]
MEKIKQAYNTEDFREKGHEMVDFIADFLQDSLEEKNKVIQYKKPENQLEYWKNYNKNGIDFLKDVTENSIHLHNPKYIGHQVSAIAPFSAITSMLTSTLNNGMAIYEMGSTATALEKIIAEKFAEKLNFSKNADGFLTSGGTLASLTALLAARQEKSEKDVWKNGNSENYAIMVSEQAHYCIDRAARIMGLGEQGIIKIPSNEKFEMDISCLENEFQKAQEKNLKVIAIVGSACSTSTGSYDDLHAISTFAKEKNIWFHIDGAHGGAVVFSEKYKHLLDGVEKADSVIIDLHKMMMTPALATIVMFKNKKHSYQTFHQKAQYLWEKHEDEDWFNLAKRTFECTKYMMSVKFMSIVQEYGYEVFEEFIDKTHDTTLEFAKLIEKHPNFELPVTPKSNILCFKLISDLDIQEQNNIHSKIRQKLIENGDFYIVQTTLNGKVYLRLTLMNPFTELKHLEILLEDILKLENTFKTEKAH